MIIGKERMLSIKCGLLSLIVLSGLSGMQKRLEPKHKPSQSMPAVFGRFNSMTDLEMQEITQTTNEEIQRLTTQPTSPTEIIIPVELNRELSEKCQLLLDKLHECQEYKQPVVAIPVKCSKKIVYYSRKSGRWLCEHKKDITLVIAGGACCIYLGYRIGKMTNLCSDAEDTCSDAIETCGRAADLLQMCTTQSSGFISSIMNMIKDGTLDCLMAGKECIDTFGAMLDYCSRCPDLPAHTY